MHHTSIELRTFAFILAITIPIHPALLDEVNVSVSDPVVGVYALTYAIPIAGILIQRIGWATGLFITCACVSTLIGSAEPSFSAKEFLLQMAKLAVSIVYLATAIHLANFKRDALDLLLDATLAVAASFAVYSILEVFVLGTAPRAAFPYNNPNAYAAYLTFAFAIGCRNAVAGRYMLLSIVACGLLLGGILATGSRGAIVGVALGLLVATISASLRGRLSRSEPRRGGFIAVVGVVALSSTAAAWLVTSDSVEVEAVQRITASIEGEGRNISIRLALWQVAGEAFQESPIFGIGLGQFPGYAERAIGINHVTHNTYLSFLAETGLVGFTIFAAFIGYLFRCTLICVRANTSAVWFTVVLFALLAQAMFTNVDNFRELWIFVGILMVSASDARRSLRWGMGRSHASP